MLAYNVEKSPDLHANVAFMDRNQARLQNVKVKSQRLYSSAVTFVGLFAVDSRELRFRSCTEEAEGQTLMPSPC